MAIWWGFLSIYYLCDWRQEHSWVMMEWNHHRQVNSSIVLILPTEKYMPQWTNQHSESVCERLIGRSVISSEMYKNVLTRILSLDQNSRNDQLGECDCSACGFSIFFSSYISNTIPNEYNKDCKNSIRNISETFHETIVQGICLKKSTTRQGLICAKILPLHVLPPSPPE